MQMIGTPDLEHIEHLRYAWWMLSEGCITNFMAMLGFRLEAKNRTFTNVLLTHRRDMMTVQPSSFDASAWIDGSQRS